MFPNKMTLSYNRQAELPFLNQSQDVAKYALNTFDFESIDLTMTVNVIFLNSKNAALGFLQIASGGLDTSIIDNKLILGAALTCAAQKIIVTRNAPAGTMKLSKPDEAAITKLKTAAGFLDILFLDYVVVASDGNYYSTADETNLL